ncbi:MAG: putative RDD family membrane protein YckC [Bacteroidia bacterium]|jgi:uncharacterized RDD family membrane protein YckC
MLTQQERLAFCKVCSNRSFDSKVGITCGLTKRPPNFVDTCVDYKEDERQITRDFERGQGNNTSKQSNTLTPASMGVRFANCFIDGIIHTAIYLILVFGRISSGALAEGEIFIIRIAVFLFYYTLFEGTTGKTIGKMITGTMVVIEDGSKPTTDKIIGRTFSRLNPFNTFSFLFLDGVGWHDTITGTRVVSKKRRSVGFGPRYTR